MNQATGIGEVIPSLLLMVVMIVVFYFMLIRPQKKKDKAVKDMLNALKVSDRVCTIGGIYGTVTGLNITPRMKNNPGKVWRAAPHYGEDNADILAELGYSEEEIQAFVDKNLLNSSDKV